MVMAGNHGDGTGMVGETICIRTCSHVRFVNTAVADVSAIDRSEHTLIRRRSLLLMNLTGDVRRRYRKALELAEVEDDVWLHPSPLLVL